MLQLIEISLICTGIHVCFMEGMVFYKLRLNEYFMLKIIHKIYCFLTRTTSCDEKYYSVYEKLKHTPGWISKPLYDCLPCMASFWTCIILWKIDIKAMLIVCGMNAIVASLLQFFDNTKLPENE